MKKSLLWSGAALVVGAAVWHLGPSHRWADRLPPGWNSVASYIGTQTNADAAGRLPAGDAPAVYQRSVRVLGATERPHEVLVEDRLVVRVQGGDSVVWQYTLRQHVDQRTGAVTDPEHRGDIAFFPRGTEKRTYHLRSTYVKGIPMSFVHEEEVSGLPTYEFGYRGRGEYTQAYAGPGSLPGMRILPGQEIRCADDQFYYRAWIEPVTGETVKVEEGCPSGDFLYDASGRALAVVDRWSGQFTGNTLLQRVARVEHDRTLYEWTVWYVPLLLLLAGIVCIGVAAFAPARARHRMPAVRLRGLSMSTKVLLQFAGAFAGIAILTATLQFRIDSKEVYGEVERAGMDLTQLVQDLVAAQPQLWSAPALGSIVDRFAQKFPDLIRLQVSDAAGTMLADSDPRLAERAEFDRDRLIAVRARECVRNPHISRDGHRHLRLTCPLRGRYDPARHDDVLGVISVVLDLTASHARIVAGVVGDTLVVLAVLFGFGVLLYLLTRRQTVAPILRLTAAARQFGSDGQWEPLEIQTGDELELLAGTLAAAAQERESSRNEIAAQRAFFREVLDMVPSFVFVKDRDSRFVFANRALADAYGVAHDALVGRSDAEFSATPEEARRFHDDDVGVIERNEELHVPEERITDAQGRERWLATVKRPIVDPTGERRVLGVAVDITHYRRAEAAERAARQAAEAASRAKSDFLANMSHEIRTPMNGVLGMLELALETELTEPQREYVHVARSSAEALLVVINDILDFSKIEAGYLQLDPTPFRLEEMLGDTLDGLVVQAHDKDLELALDVDPRLPAAFIGDAGRLRQIVVNLVGNAIKFTERGEIVLQVAATESDDREVLLHVAVRDTGIGIPPEKRELIFDAFAQADASTTRLYGGTGLGLSICSRLVAAMRGRIWVESVVGRGSTFHFAVPLEVDHAAPADSERTVAPRLDGLHVLVVDDNATNRRILERVLTTWQMHPVLVDGGVAALAELQRAVDAGHPFQLLIVDRQMPHMDGFALIDRVRTNPRFAGSTIMMLSSVDGPDGVRRCRELGVSLHLTKPVRHRELFDAIVSVLTGGTDAASARSAGSLCHPLSGGASGTAASERPVLHGLRVLLAEDNRVNQRVACTMLERHGHSVTVVENGRAALAAITASRFDLLLLDVQMPEMDGFRTATLIREYERGRAVHLPIVAMTARATTGDRERCLAAGMDAYLAKPVRTEELFAAIAALVGTVAAPAAPPAPTAGHIDALVDDAALRTLVSGDRQLLRELLGLFEEDAPRRVDEIASAVERGDAEALRLAAHSLRGASASLTAQRVSVAARRLEEMGRHGDLAAAPSEVELLRGALDATLRVMATLGEN